MAGESLYESLTNALVDGVRDALDHVDSYLPALDPPDEAGARQALNDLVTRAQAITNAGDPASWFSNLEQWKSTLDDLAEKAFGGPTPLDSLLVRVLEERMPRTAAFLTFVGVIVPSPGAQDRIDRAKAQQFFTDPGTLVNEALWDALLGDASIPGTGRLPAVIVGVLLLAPQTIIGMAHGDLQVAGLPSPPTDAPGPWRTFRESSDDWLSITVPLGDPASATPMPRGLYDWHADLLPDITATLAMRSGRESLGGGNNRTTFEMWLAIALEANEWRYSFTDSDGVDTGWFLKVEPGISGGFGYDGSWHGAFRQMLTNTSLIPGPKDPLEVTFGRDTPGGAPDLILGPPYDTRLVAQDVGLFLRLREDHPIVEIGAMLHGFSVVLTNRWWRTFGVTNELFGDGIRLDLDLDIAYVEGKGLQLNLGAGLDITFHINKEWGKDSSVGLKLHSIRLYIPIQATQSSFDIRGEVTFHVSLKIGPVVLVVEGLGGWGGYWTEDGAKHYAGFLPPTGAGLQISYGPVSGGGFLEWGRLPNLNEHFAGVLYLKIYAFEITAFGIHELTGKPGDAVRKTSLVLVLGVRFSPGIQLGYGFAITGFGGLIGINRRADTDALRERLTSGAAGNVLFAEDPIRNAPELLSDLGALFPAANDTYVFGPTAQVSWLKIGSFKVFKIDAGIFFEITGSSLTKIILLGSVRATIPDVGDEVPKLLQLRFDIVGFVDFPKSILEVDATLINSKALYAFHLTGDLAVRISWGERPYLLLSLGGFHPRFDPKPAQFPDLTRLALTLDTEGAGLFFRAEAYLAITSNTIQFGTRIEVGYKLGPFNLAGFLSLDAIIQFSPFWFEIAISAGVRLRWNETTLCGVRLEGILSGPGPFTISGKACIEILFFDICGSATITLGPSANSAAPPSTSSSAQALTSEVTDPDNLSSDGGDDRCAVQKVRPSAAGAPPVVSPLGQLRWMQKRAPLGTTLDRFEGQPLAAQQRVVASCALANGAATDWFAPGSFAELSESEALNRPGFERLDAGLVLGAALQQSSKVPHDVSVVEVRLPKWQLFLLADAFSFAAVTLAGARARLGAAAVRTTAAKIGVGDERFIVRDAAGTKIAGDTSVTEAHQTARRVGGVALHADDIVVLEGV
ncbi:MAG: hypothetical protein QOG69_2338 [Actinomycetota bacterium]|nr:hypothetical protein [Actinomycetota bacterium]